MEEEVISKKQLLFSILVIGSLLLAACGTTTPTEAVEEPAAEEPAAEEPETQEQSEPTE